MLFWLWVLVALGVYSHRIWRRVTKGPKAERQAAAASAPDGKGRLARSSPPPLPDGPVEARLPKALQVPGPAAAGDPDPEGRTGADGAPGSEGPSAVPSRIPTVAEVVEGIRMPDGLLPVVDPSDLAPRDGRVARFSGTGTTVEVVTAELASELMRLGFAVDGLTTASAVRAGLSASRDDASVGATVAYDDDSTAVVVELTTG